MGGDSDGSCLFILLAAAVLLVAWFNAATLGCPHTCTCRIYDVPAYVLCLCRAHVACIGDTYCAHMQVRGALPPTAYLRHVTP